MAVLARWSSGAAALFPTTAWAQIPSLFANEDRNDSDYSLNLATSTIDIGATPAQGYLIRASVRVVCTHNNRAVLRTRIVQTSGGGSFVGGETGDYSRNSANNQNESVCWAFIDGATANSEFSLEWRRTSGSGTPAGSVVEAVFELIPFSYSSLSMYSGSTIQGLNGLTPVQITLDSTIIEGANISRSGNVITVSGDNKKYLVLSSYSSEGRGGRTQRWLGHSYDGVQERKAMSCIYYRDTSNDDLGRMITDILTTSTTDRTIELFGYRGDGTTFDTSGASVDGSNPSQVDVKLCVIELNDGVEIFVSGNSSVQTITSGNNQLNVSEVVDSSDSSFTQNGNIGCTSQFAGDALVGFNIGAGYLASSATRHQASGRLTKNGIIDTKVSSNNYGRGDQGTQDTWGFSHNTMGFVNVAVSDNLGAQSNVTGNTGPMEARAGWSRFWAINLETLDSGAPPVLPTRAYSII